MTSPDATPSDDKPPSSPARAVARGLLAILVLAAGIGAALYFQWSERRAARGDGGEQESARLVATTTVERGTARVVLEAMGTVEPAREVTIRPRVAGRIVEQAESFLPGGHFEAGERMLRIDPADYRHAVRRRESDLEQAKASLRIEEGDQAVAREELELLEMDLAGANRALILREPQVRSAEAAVASARAALEQAKLDLERTRVEAPFDGQILTRSVNAGDTVAAGDALATYAGAERYWVEVAVPLRTLRWIELPAQGGSKGGSRVEVTQPDAWGPDAHRAGRVARRLGQVEAESKRAELLIRVPDPLAQDEARAGKPALLLGSFVDVRIRGRRLEDVVVLDPAFVREGETVWTVNEEDRLAVREVSVALETKRAAYIDAGLPDGARVVKTNLSAPAPGMLLREASSGSAANEGEEGADES